MSIAELNEPNSRLNVYETLCRLSFNVIPYEPETPLVWAGNGADYDVDPGYSQYSLIMNNFPALAVDAQVTANFQIFRFNPELYNCFIRVSSPDPNSDARYLQVQFTMNFEGFLQVVFTSIGGQPTNQTNLLIHILVI